MLQVILVDDEPNCLTELSNALQGQVQVVGAFENPFHVLEKIAMIAPDAAFLDIEMPGMDGFSLAVEILNMVPNISIIFVTAHSQFATKAFEIDAVDYILKPFSSERLQAALRKLERQRVSFDPEDILRLKQAIHREIVEQKLQRIILWSNNGVILVNISQIKCCFVEKGRRGVRVVTDDGECSSRDSFQDFLDKVGEERLIRCHRSFAVNPNHLREIGIDHNSTMVAQIDGCSRLIPVSRQYGPVLRRKIGLRGKLGGPKSAQ